MVKTVPRELSCVFVKSEGVKLLAIFFHIIKNMTLQFKESLGLYNDKNVLKRRRECGTYLATAHRHRRRIKMKRRDE